MIRISVAYQSTPQTLILLLFSFLLFHNCQPDSKSETSSDSTSKSIPSNDSGTAEMIKHLEQAKNQIDPMQVTYFENGQRAAIFQQRVENSQNPDERYNNTMFYGYELINAGKNEDAIMILEGLLQQLLAINLQQPGVLYQIKRLIALAYIRLGEQNNCIQRHNEESCIMPIRGKGIYTITEATEKAIQVYEEMLALNPEDQESIWMLNFAYMTLGQFPDKVPAQFRLSPSEFESDYQIPKFKNLAGKLGINTVGLSGGAAIEDFDNDGFLDLMASSWGFEDQLQFFRNNGDGTFSNQTQKAGLTGITGGLNINHADYNNDGFIDVLVLRGAWFGAAGKVPNSLLKNNGDGTFTDVTIATGLLSFFPTQTATWADFNLDGHLDLFIGNESDKSLKVPCEFYINNGDGTFTNRINETGLSDIQQFVKGVNTGDFNNDGFPDLYISLLDTQNKLFINTLKKAGDIPKFEDKTSTAGVGEPQNSFPTWSWDYNNDGWEDIFVASFSYSGSLQAAQLAALNYRGQSMGGHPRIYKNNGDDTFTDISQSIGMTEAMLAMGCNYGDIDNDGYQDFYLGTGAPSFTAIVPNKMFRNLKGQTFQDVTTAGGVGHIQKGHAVSFGDFDNDGDQDIFCVLGGAFEGDVFEDAFFLNPFGSEKNWVNIKLEGTKSNKAAIGARVTVSAQNPDGSEKTIYRTVSTGSSFGSNSLQLEIGLENALEINSIEIRWPNAERTIEIFENVAINRFVKVVEGSGQVQYLERQKLDLAL